VADWSLAAALREWLPLLATNDRFVGQGTHHPEGLSGSQGEQELAGLEIGTSEDVYGA
jgi:hypothetical protein